MTDSQPPSVGQLGARQAACVDGPLDEFAALVDACDRIVVFTGAGISTESGIPDFRSPGGIWSHHRPVSFQDYLNDDSKRQQAWELRIALNAVLKTAQPNAGHLAVQSWNQRGKLSGVITQNIDGLHQAAGVDPSSVVELHGNHHEIRCLDCLAQQDSARVEAEFRHTETVPPCKHCGGIIKSSVISFGQPLPDRALAKAHALTLQADLFVVAGSSLSVYPAAGFPELAAQHEVPLVIVNRDATPMDAAARLVFHCDIGPTLHAVNCLLNC
ncbi:MAG: Sir2 family NAD-dependent protein deacetylase [Pseudomonadota bacterium]|nr:Sir2 family NAD-dependent protein deacetylase [Pseudomonadota bacterium]